MLDTIVATAARLCHAEWARIFKLEADGKYHLAAASSGRRGSSCGTWRRTRSLPGAERSSAVPRSKAGPCTFPTCSRTPSTPGSRRRPRGGYRTVLGVPLLRGDAVIGVIDLARNIVKPFTDKRDRAGHDLRRPGRDRDRERAPVRRGAGADARADRGAPAADGDGGRAEGHQPVRIRSRSGAAHAGRVRRRGSATRTRPRSPARSAVGSTGPRRTVSRRNSWSTSGPSR